MGWIGWPLRVDGRSARTDRRDGAQHRAEARCSVPSATPVLRRRAFRADRSTRRRAFRGRARRGVRRGRLLSVPIRPRAIAALARSPTQHRRRGWNGTPRFRAVLCPDASIGHCGSDHDASIGHCGMHVVASHRPRGAHAGASIGPRGTNTDASHGPHRTHADAERHSDPAHVERADEKHPIEPMLKGLDAPMTTLSVCARSVEPSPRAPPERATKA